MIESIKSTPAESITVEATAVRQTASPTSAKFGDVLKEGAKVLLGAAGGVASVLPGGGILSAAVRGAGEAIGSSASALPPGSDPKAPGGALATATGAPIGPGGSEIDDLWAIQEAGMRTSMEVLKIQEAVSRESRVFTTLSNVMKARHDTASSAIGNIR